MDGFKNTTKMKYMSGGPVRMAMGGVAKSVAPKSVSKSASSTKQVPTPDLGSKRFIEQTRPTAEPKRLIEPARPTAEPKRLIEPAPPKDVGREFPRPTMEPKRQVQPTPPKDVRTIGGEPKAPKGAGREIPRPEMAPKDVRTIGGEPKAPKDVARPAWMEFEKTIGVGPKAPKGGMTMGKSAVDGLTKSIKGTPLTGPLGSVAKNPTKGGAALSKMAQSAAKGVSSVNTAKRGVPVASNKPMIGFKTGGHVTKSSFKW